MVRRDSEVVVIGGGITGVGVVRDLAMRGFKTTLLERADLAQGTSARFHGLLHSGGRYVISDTESATQCADENAILRRINAPAIEDTGGFFVATQSDPGDFADGWLEAAVRLGVYAEEVPVREVLRAEPRLTPGIKVAFRVNDGGIDGWRMVRDAAASAREYGADIRTYHEVTAIEKTADNAIAAVRATNLKTGETVTISCDFVVNAAGPWAGQIARLAESQGVDVVPGRGIMLGMNQRLVHHVVNRLAPPGDGDILVPAHEITLIGTTDKPAESPDFLEIRPDEVQLMLDRASELIPRFRQARALHAWAGARPLLRDTRVAAGDTRHMSRGMAVINHLERDGIAGLITVAGGKFTTYRLMAEVCVNALCRQLGVERVCRTAAEPCVTGNVSDVGNVADNSSSTDTTASNPGAAAGNNPSNGSGRYHRLSDALARAEAKRDSDQIICECELVTRERIMEYLTQHPTTNLDDLRRHLRLGMGPCQGTFCAARAAGLMAEHGSYQDAARNAEQADAALKLFLSNRSQGIVPILYGSQLREMAIQRWVRATLGIDRLPPPSPAALRATGDLALCRTLEGKPLGGDSCE